MPCLHPIRAFRTPAGAIQIGKDAIDSHPLELPCGGCLACRAAAARMWALRCTLEAHQHQHAVFTTLTYDDAHLPPTLSKYHLALWLKRLRKNATNRIRFFASGEYGERTKRPHYHAILYGLSEASAQLIENTWAMGHTRTDPLTPARIAYCAGYAAKKIGYRRHAHERVDPQTGELYTWQPPFIQMSRRPGIGGHARTHANSWRNVAIHNGVPLKVPRFFHQAWKEQAMPQQQEQLEYEKSLTRHQNAEKNTTEAREAAEQLAIAQQTLRASRRRL